MNDDPALQLLREKGDPLEILISQHRDDLFPVLSPYARVWSKHIIHRRVGDGSRIVDEWMPFGGDHYTSLIRLYHAYTAKESLLIQCKQAETFKGRDLTSNDYSLLLQTHATCAAFWENLGSTVDNLAHAWDDARRVLLGNAKNPGATEGDEQFSFKAISRERYPMLNYAYDRRTQFIHSALVPNRLEDGMIVFNLRHYDSERTDWLPETEAIESLDNQVAKDWKAVLQELGQAWERLFSWLQSKDKGQLKQAVGVATPSEAAGYSEFGIAPPILCFTTPPSGSSPLIRH
jgi:hypothetical protein